MNELNRIFKLQEEREFEALALSVFRRQAEQCAPYREYIERMGVNPHAVQRIEEIPFLPIRLFKTHEVYCGEEAPEVIFTSSATTGNRISVTLPLALY